MDTGSVERGTYIGRVTDKDGNPLTSNPKQAAIAPLKKEADLSTVINKLNEIITALKMSNIVAIKPDKE